MKFGSVCSGIEAASCAWESLGWKAAFFSEIEKFPSQVLAHHYPDVPNLGDMTKFKEWPDANIDVLVGGTPCQSFSVAGLRRGLDDPRGNLMLTFLAIADRYRPKWLVWENVPGVLSSNGGKDFGTFLGGLGELGYGFAYRVLDAQYFGVPQRRRRVFVVACLGNWQSAAAVLFERHCFEGHPAPSRKKGQDIAGTLKARANSGGWNSDVDLAAGNYMQPVAKCLTASDGQRNDVNTDNLLPMVGLQDCNNFSSDISGTIVTREGVVADTAHMVIQAYGLAGTMIGRKDENGPNGKGWYEEACPTQTKTDIHAVAITHPMAVAQPVAVGTDLYNGAITGDVAATIGTPGSSVNASGPTVMQSMAVAQPIAFSGQMSNPQTDVNLSGTLGAKNPMAVAQPIPFKETSDCLTAAYGTKWNGNASADNGSLFVAQPYSIMPMNSGKDYKARETDIAQPLMAGGPVGGNQGGDFLLQPIAPTLTAANNPSRSPQASEVTDQIAAVYATSMAVRRLTPVECERLQGFPDGYTDIKLRGKETPDGPRYKALGNSMAVPVMRWIGERIQLLEDCL